MNEAQSGIDELALKIKTKSGEQEGIQKKTFTRWLNIQFSKARANAEVKDIFKDLRDGTKLILLLEILTGTKVKREKGRLRVHHLNNVGHALKFLTSQKVKFVNIRNDDIVNGNPKLTLALIWCIILHYQVSDVLRDVVGDNVQDMSKVEKTLLDWCKQSTKGYEGVNVVNLTTSWRNGLAFNALIHRHRPDLFDYKPLLRNNSRGNLEHAFKVAHTHLGVGMLLEPEDVDRDRPDKKSIMMYLTSLFDTLPHEEYQEEIQSLPVTKSAQNENEALPGEEKTSSPGEWRDYNEKLNDVLAWLEKAEMQLNSQAKISDDVDVVKDQFHEHEKFMIDLTNHQSNIGSVLDLGNGLISEALVGEKEVNQIREQLIMLNARWEALRLAAMDRQSKLHEQLMDLQQKQIDELGSWLTSAEAKIEGSAPVGSDTETVERQIEDHKRFQEDLEAQQQKVNSLTHMVVVVDDNANDNATAELEEQLGIMEERFSRVCTWTEERWEQLLVLQMSWQQYLVEESRLNEWLTSKEREVNEMNKIDASNIDDVHRTIDQLQRLEVEMTEKQASFQDFNDAARKVAENVPEDSALVKQIQDQMEDFNERWKALTSQVTQRISLLKGLDIKLIQLKKEIDDSVQWMEDTQTLLNTPMSEPTKVSSKELEEKEELIQSLDNAVKKRKTSINDEMNKAEEIIAETRSVSYRATTVEQLLADFTSRWEKLCSLLDERKKWSFNSIIEVIVTLEERIIEAEQERDRMEQIPHDEMRIQEQKKIIEPLEQAIADNEPTVTAVNRTGNEIIKHSSVDEAEILRNKLDDLNRRWNIICTEVSDKQYSMNEEDLEYEELANESQDLTQWMTQVEVSLAKPDPSPADLDGLQHQLAHVKDIEFEMVEKEDVVDGILKTRQRLQTKPILSKPSKEDVMNPVEAVETQWQSIKVAVPYKRNSLEDRISDLEKFDADLEELYLWTSSTKDLIDNEANLGKKDDRFLEEIERNLTDKSSMYDHVNMKYEKYQEESLLSTSAIPNSMHEKWRKMNADWEAICRFVEQPSMTIVVEKNTVSFATPDILVSHFDEDKTPWPKFDKAVLELHDWLSIVEEVIKSQRIMLGNVDEMERLTNKQKQSVEDELRGKHYLLNDISEMSLKLEEETDDESHKTILRQQVQSLKDHWHRVQQQSNEWLTRINLMWDLWRQYEQIKTDLEAWLTSAEEKMVKVWKESGNTVVEPEELLTNHKNFVDEVESWQPLVDRLNDVGNELIREFPEHNPSDIRLTSHRDTQRYNKLASSCAEHTDKLSRLVQFDESMTEALTWLTSTESKIAELDSAADAAEEHTDHSSLKEELKVLEVDINNHHETFASLNETGQTVMCDLESGEVLAALQSKLDDINDRWNSLNARLNDVRHKFDGGATEWALHVQEIVDWINRAIQELEAQKPVGNDIGTVNVQLETHQPFRNELNKQRLVIDRALESGKRHLDSDNTFQSASSSQLEFPEIVRSQLSKIREDWPVLVRNSEAWQKTLEEALQEIKMVQEHLKKSVVDPWEREISANNVPYYINHNTERTQWDHPKMTNLYHHFVEINDVIWSAYRTAMKLRCIQKIAGLDMVDINVVIEAFKSHDLCGSHEDIIGVSEMVKVLTSIFEKLERNNGQTVNIPLSIDLSLNWILNVYDSGRIGKIREFSFKIGLICLCKGSLDEKYENLFSLLADSSGHLSPHRMGLLLHDQLQIPKQLGEAAAFGGSNIEPSVRSCFEWANKPEAVTSNQFLQWLANEPQSVIWLPTLHRYACSEGVKHEAKCQICKEYPIVGLRFRSLRYFNYDLCQSCFFSGRTSRDHLVTHPMHQYCLSTTGSEDVKDFFKVIKNKMKPRKCKNKPPKNLGYLPVQTIMEGPNLESPLSPPPRNNQNTHTKMQMHAKRLLDLEATETDSGSQTKGKSLDSSSIPNQVQSPAQIMKELAEEEKEDLDKTIADLEDENRTLLEELSHLKSLTTSLDGHQQDSENDVIDEIKLLQQHKARHESRVEVLEDHNRQLQEQLEKLKQIYEQRFEKSTSPTIQPVSMERPDDNNDSTAGENNDHGEAPIELGHV